MRRYLLRLLITVTAFALGFASSNLWPRQRQSQPTTTIAIAPSSTEKERCAPRGTDDDTRVEDRYYNYNFGFSVDLPAGMFGMRQSAPTPQHGFGVDMNNPQSTFWAKQNSFPVAYLYVDGSYNSAMLESLDDAVTYQLRYMSERSNGGHVLLSKSATRLAGLPAMRFVARHKERNEMLINDVTIAFRKEHGVDGAEVIYMLNLDTPEATYERDKAIVAKMQKTFCLQPLP